MTRAYDNLDEFRMAYLDYLEGYRDEPPAVDDLPREERQAAEAFIVSITASRGVDPYASRPSIEQLLAAGPPSVDRVKAIGMSLQAGLRVDVDQRAWVVSDVASVASGLASELVIHARGMRVRVVIELSSSDLDAGFAARVNDIAAVFGAFPDTNAVLYAYAGLDPCGVIVERSDVHDAVEIPSGASRAPRLRWPIADIETVCTSWVQNAIPTFEPPRVDLLEAGIAHDSILDLGRLAARAVHEVSAAGGRAQITAKRAAWSALGEPEARQLADIVTEAQRGPMSEDRYRHCLDSIVGEAA